MTTLPSIPPPLSPPPTPDPPSLSALYPPPEALSDDLPAVICSALRSAATLLTPPSSPLAPLLHALFHSLPLPLNRNLAPLPPLILRLLTPPAATPLPLLLSSLAAARSLHDPTAESALDLEVAAIRARLRDATARMHALSAAVDATREHVEVLRGVAEKGMAVVGGGMVGEVEECVGEAEVEYEEGVRILGRWGGRGMREAAAVVARGGEHEPLESFAMEACTVVKAWGGGGEWGKLRDALMG